MQVLKLAEKAGLVKLGHVALDLNVLDKLPKSMQPNAHKDLREIWLSPSRGAAEAAMTTFAEKYAPKYDKAVECLIKDRQTLLTFFDLPADHWDHPFLRSPAIFRSARATSWRRAEPRLQALPGRRHSSPAGLRRPRATSLGGAGFHPLTKCS